MRYAQGGGLTPAERQAREQVRREVAAWFEGVDLGGHGRSTIVDVE
jgi:hypothetical protein